MIGYTTQARFLMNCGILELLQGADVRTTANTQKLLTEHEMGELFKVIGLAKGSTSIRSASRTATAPTRFCDEHGMRWLIVFLLAFLVFQGLADWLRRIGLGRLPGDFSFRFRGREWHLPIASSLLLSLIAMAIGALI